MAGEKFMFFNFLTPQKLAIFFKNFKDYLNLFKIGYWDENEEFI